jgi:hypothetical protein
MKSRIAAQMCNEITHCSAKRKSNHVLPLTLKGKNPMHGV